METSFKDEDTHLVVVWKGRWTAEVVKELLRLIRDEAVETSHTKILVNCLEVSAPASEYHRYQAGLDVAEILSNRFRIAVLYPKELINKFAENTAVNRAANLFVCHDEKEALCWLLD